MPLYVFSCEEGHSEEIFFFMRDKPENVVCSTCGKIANQVPAIGGITTDSPVWLDDGVREVLQDSDRVRKKLEPPIETRKQWKAAVKRLGLECTG